MNLPLSSPGKSSVLCPLRCFPSSPPDSAAQPDVNPNLGGSPLNANVRTIASMQDPYLLAPAGYPFRFILAMYGDPAGNLYFGDDPFAGSRAQRGHSWIVPSVASHRNSQNAK